ncbi:hypothetical protein AAEP80_04085 [Curtobacterium sp. L3-7]|uniref:hypothetical protein n=1 Tax=Curtobacterium sp. L3-7 TaxID=3138787 RepID=UPI003B52F4D2
MNGDIVWPELDPAETIALAIARSDMHYVSCSLIGLDGIANAAELGLLQYGVMAAYEAQTHFKRSLGIDLQADWDADTAKAARMSGKFFADNKQHLSGVVSHFEELLDANHQAYFPVNRLRPEFDFLRDDLSVVTLDGRPYMTSVSAHFLMGLRSDQTATLDQAGPAAYRLSVGAGNIAGALLNGSEVAYHSPSASLDFVAWDATSAEALSRLFARTLPPTLAIALATVQSVVRSAELSSARVGCSWCETAARKHRFVALYQGLLALHDLRREQPAFVPANVSDLIDDERTRWVLMNDKLRNGLIHLGMQDIASRLHRGDSPDEAISAYTGLTGDEVDERTKERLYTLGETLTTWMLTPPPSGPSFADALHTPPD